jgi:hypothetical protein
MFFTVYYALELTFRTDVAYSAISRALIHVLGAFN